MVDTFASRPLLVPNLTNSAITDNDVCNKELSMAFDTGVRLGKSLFEVCLGSGSCCNDRDLKDPGDLGFIGLGLRNSLSILARLSAFCPLEFFNNLELFGPGGDRFSLSARVVSAPTPLLEAPLKLLLLGALLLVLETVERPLFLIFGKSI